MKILVVDADRGSRRLVEIASSASGHEVVASRCIHGAQAEVLTSRFDLVIASLEVEEQAVLEWGRTSGQLLGTGAPQLWGIIHHSQTDARHQALRAGFDLVLVKPFDIVSLVRTLAGDPRCQTPSVIQPVHAPLISETDLLDRRVRVGLLSGS